MQPSVCRICGNVMEAGFLVAESYIGGTKWIHGKTILAIGGERVAKTDDAGNVYIQGFRWANCRHLSLCY